eukprot:TRINITY_DN86700_c0_g1_i1.p1 TRINITY_DN86700_c0_g1~~TRINITY_DN86700_c0_g1_i1.p1  ORF type:complete len:296 (-),score=7.05 TRINITY_DN86700_c0_g1_i1:93-944(-)
MTAALLPSLPYATGAVVQSLKPTKSFFQRFGGEVGQGPGPSFETFYGPTTKLSDIGISLTDTPDLGTFEGILGSQRPDEGKHKRRRELAAKFSSINQSNLKLVHKGLLAHVGDDGKITHEGFCAGLRGLGLATPEPIVTRLFKIFKRATAKDMVYHEFVHALDRAVNGDFSINTTKACFSLFDDQRCGYILKTKLLQLRVKQAEENGQTHLMIKVLLNLIDELERTEDEKSMPKKKKGKKKGALPPIQKYMKKAQISQEEFAEAFKTDAFLVQCFLPVILMCV